MAVIDTSTLIDLMKNRDNAYGTVKKKQPANTRSLVSAVSFFELAAGAPAGISEKRRRFLDAFAIVPLNEEQAELAGEIFAQLREKGLEIDAADTMIAATALATNEPLVTRNPKHFKRITGLEVITY